ncbi:hypothetical protein [Kitasatospora purpeofusca]|uniref:hypothetical protein n=1 Tax=Kitasatospora purpeofusca TaxID=67352 RepID=UPI00381518DF
MGKHPRRRDRSSKGATSEAVEYWDEPDAVLAYEVKGSGNSSASKSLVFGSSRQRKGDIAAAVTAALGPGGRRSLQLPGITSTALPTLEGPRAREVRRAQAGTSGPASTEPAGFDAAAVLGRMDAAGAGAAPVPTQEIVDTVRSVREGPE